MALIGPAVGLHTHTHMHLSIELEEIRERKREIYNQVESSLQLMLQLKCMQDSGSLATFHNPAKKSLTTSVAPFLFLIKWSRLRRLNCFRTGGQQLKAISSVKRKIIGEGYYI